MTVLDFNAHARFGSLGVGVHASVGDGDARFNAIRAIDVPPSIRAHHADGVWTSDADRRQFCHYSPEFRCERGWFGRGHPLDGVDRFSIAHRYDRDGRFVGADVACANRHGTIVGRYAPSRYGHACVPTGGWHGRDRDDSIANPRDASHWHADIDRRCDADARPCGPPSFWKQLLGAVCGCVREHFFARRQDIRTPATPWDLDGCPSPDARSTPTVPGKHVVDTVQGVPVYTRDDLDPIADNIVATQGGRVVDSGHPIVDTLAKDMNAAATYVLQHLPQFEARHPGWTLALDVNENNGVRIMAIGPDERSTLFAKVDRADGEVRLIADAVLPGEPSPRAATATTPSPTGAASSWQGVRMADTVPAAGASNAMDRYEATLDEQRARRIAALRKELGELQSQASSPTAVPQGTPPTQTPSTASPPG